MKGVRIKHKRGSKNISIVFHGSETREEIYTKLSSIKSSILANYINYHKHEINTFQVVYKVGYSESYLRRQAKLGHDLQPYTTVPATPAPKTVKLSPKDIIGFVSEETDEYIEGWENEEPDSPFMNKDYGIRPSLDLRIREINIKFLFKVKQERK